MHFKKCPLVQYLHIYTRSTHLKVPQASAHITTHFLSFTIATCFTILKVPSSQCYCTHTLCTLHKVSLSPVFTYPHTLYPSQSIPQPSVHVPTHFVPFTKYPSAQCSRTNTLCTLHKVPLGTVAAFLCTGLLTGGREAPGALVYNYTRTHSEQCYNKHNHNGHYHN